MRKGRHVHSIGHGVARAADLTAVGASRLVLATALAVIVVVSTLSVLAARNRVDRGRPMRAWRLFRPNEFTAVGNRYRKAALLATALGTAVFLCLLVLLDRN